MRRSPAAVPVYGALILRPATRRLLRTRGRAAHMHINIHAGRFAALVDILKTGEHIRLLLCLSLVVPEILHDLLVGIRYAFKRLGERVPDCDCGILRRRIFKVADPGVVRLEAVREHIGGRVPAQAKAVLLFRRNEGKNPNRSF